MTRLTMNTKLLDRTIKGTLLALGAGALLIVTSHSKGGAGDEKPAQASDQSVQASVTQERIAKGGSQLWSENCARCHNMRSSSSYSDAEWVVAMQHMRVRANLTAEEHKKILEFLKSGN